jgi:hypothetical protein
MGVSGQLQAPAALPSGKESSGVHRIGGWVGPTPVWTLWRREIHLAPAEIRTMVRILRICFVKIVCRFLKKEMCNLFIINA